MSHSFVTSDGAHICTPFRGDLATLIPHAKTIDYQGQKLLVLPNRSDETKLARNLGVYLPAPILSRYDWRSQKPWDIQRTTAALLSESSRAYVLSTMGTGKTRSVLYAFDWLKQVGQARKMLVSCPLSTLSPVWEDELWRNFPHLSWVVLHGPRRKRFELLERDVDVYIVNHHGVPILADAINARGIDIVTVDELAVLRNKQTTMWKAHATVVNDRLPFAWGLTGSPTPLAPTDAWAQIRLLTPGRVARTMGQFQDQTMRKVSNFKWVAREEANDVVHAAMQPSVRFTRDDIAELPPTSYVNREVKLEPKAQSAYKMLFDRMAHVTDKGQTITAANEGILQMKLLQVACGYIYTDSTNSKGEREIYELPHNTRLAALDEVISETDRKVIVFLPFVHALAGVSAYLRKQGHDVGVISGATPRHQRDAIFRGFQSGASPRIIVAHPQTMAHGLTLTAANVIVWYAPHPSLEIYEQANARIVRPGQTAKTIIAHLYGTPVERATYTRLRARGKMQGLLLALFKDQELDI